MQAQKSLSSISANRDLWMAQYHQELAERDRFSGLQAARKEGHKEGLKEGLKEGMKKTARNALIMGIPVEQVSKITGLSEDEVRALQK